MDGDFGNRGGVPEFNSEGGGAREPCTKDWSELYGILMYTMDTVIKKTVSGSDRVCKDINGRKGKGRVRRNGDCVIETKMESIGLGIRRQNISAREYTFRNNSV